MNASNLNDEQGNAPRDLREALEHAAWYSCPRSRCARVAPGLFDVVYRFRGQEVGPGLLCAWCVAILRDRPECELELVGQRGAPLADLRVAA